MKMQLKQTLENLFNYDPLTGNLIRKIASSNSKCGDVAGHNHARGYVRIRVNGKMYFAHRLVWIMHFGDIPDGLQIDHINCIKNDNRIENLRLASSSINTQNKRSARKDNTIGLLGVRRHVSGKFEAQIQLGGKKRYLGLFETPQVAHSAYVEAKRKFHEGCTI